MKRVVLWILTVTLVLVFVLRDDKITGTWEPVLDPNIGYKTDKAILTKGGKRLFMFLPRDDSWSDTTLLKVYDQNHTDPFSRWYLHSEMRVPAPFSAVPSEDGSHIALLSFANITVLRERRDTTGTWEQVGEVVVPLDLMDGETALNTTNLNLFATERNAVVLSEDGKVLTVWASVRWPTEYNYGMVASFRQENETWVLKDRQSDVITSPFRVQSDTFRLYMAESGGVIAVGLYSFDGEEMMNVYEYKTPTKWSLVESFSEPPGQDFDSRFGQAGDISYDGRVIAVSAPNYEGKGRFRLGFVKVFEKEVDGAYQQRGQTIEPSTDCVIGKHVALSKDGNRMAVSSNCNTNYIKAYEFQSGKWKQLGNAIASTYIGYTSVQHVSMSSDGSRIAVSWYYQTMVYELQ